MRLLEPDVGQHVWKEEESEMGLRIFNSDIKQLVDQVVYHDWAASELTSSIF